MKLSFAPSVYRCVLVLESAKELSDRERADKALIGSFGKRLTYRRTSPLYA